MEVLTAAPSVEVVLGVGGPEKTEGSGVGSTGAGRGDAGTEGAGASCSSICSIGGGCSSAGISAAGWSSSRPEGGK